METPIPVSSEDVTLLACCPHCQKIQRLEACLDCYKAMCSLCMKSHVEKWKLSANKYCSTIDVKIKRYLVKIDDLKPMSEKNSSKVKRIKLEIDETYNQLVEKLRLEKEEIFKTLDDIDNENKLFKNFENDILDLKKDLDEFREISQTTEKYGAIFTKFQDCKKKVTIIGKDYNGIRNKPLKIIGDYEKPAIIEKSFFGNLIINESELLKSQVPLKSIEKAIAPKLNNKIHMFGTLRVQLKKVTEQMSEFQQILKAPSAENEVPTMPNFLVNHKNTLFISDEEGNLTVAESKEELTVKYSLKLSFGNVKGIAVNQNYLAIVYSGLSKDILKVIAKKLKIKKLENKSGIALYKWEEPFRIEKVIELNKQTDLQGGLLAPNGIAMNDSHVFVSDKQWRCIFKIDLKSGDITDRLPLGDSEPIGLAVSSNCLAMADSKNQELNLISITNFNHIIKSVRISEDFQSFGGEYDLVFHQSTGSLFLKNRSDSRIITYDHELNFKSIFEYESSNFQGLSLLQLCQTNSEVIVIGKNIDNKFFKVGYFNDF